MNDEETKATLSLMCYILGSDMNSLEETEELIRITGLNKECVLASLKNILKKVKISNLLEFIRKFKFKIPEYSVGEKFLLFNPLKSLYYKRDQAIRLEEFPFERFKYSKAGEYCGHVSQVGCVCFDKSQRFFFSGGDDGTIKLWDVKSGLLVRSLIGHRYSINDMCVSVDGKYLSSCDSIGTLIIWNLEEFNILYSIQGGSEIEFVEFNRTVKTEKKVKKYKRSNKLEYNLVLVESRGIIKNYIFDDENIITENENVAISETSYEGSIRAICITEGGRFLLCGGLWPFLLVFDIFNMKDKLMVLETEGYSIISVCASKNRLKFAASTLFNVLIQWEFSEEGNPMMGNFKKRRMKENELKGHWKKNVVTIEIGEDYYCERITYLQDDSYIIAMCTDTKLRIFQNLKIFKIIENIESGIITPHPKENIFIVGGEELRIMNVEGQILFSEKLNFKLVDCQFSNDGEYFVATDEIGYVKIYACFPFIHAYKNTPKEQFFSSDFSHINQLFAAFEGEYFIECDNSNTYDSAGVKNENWYLKKYSLSGNNKQSDEDDKSLSIENLAYEHLHPDFFNLEKFKKKYFVMNEPVEENDSPVQSEIASSSSVADESLSFESTDEGTNGESSSEEKSDGNMDVNSGRNKRKAALRAINYNNGETSEEEQSEEVKKSRRKSAETESKRRKKKEESISDTSLEESSIVEIRRGRRNNRAKETEGVLKNTEDFEEKSRQAAEFLSNSEGSKMVLISQNEEELKEYVDSWMTSADPCDSYFPQMNEKVFFILERFKEFKKFETRNEFFINDVPKKEGVYFIRNIEFKSYSPNYLEISLQSEEDNSLYKIKYYDYPDGAPIFVPYSHYEKCNNYKFKKYSKVKVIFDKKIFEGKVIKIEENKLTIKFEDESVDTIENYDVFFDEQQDSLSVNNKESQKREKVLQILESKRNIKSLYQKIRIASNPSYHANVVCAINLGTIVQRIRNYMYRTVDALFFDLNTVLENSCYLSIDYEDICKNIVNEIYKVYKNGISVGTKKRKTNVVFHSSSSSY